MVGGNVVGACVVVGAVVTGAGDVVREGDGPATGDGLAEQAVRAKPSTVERRCSRGTSFDSNDRQPLH